jgi:glutathione S-transferase
MNYTLIGSFTSPYVRKMRLLLFSLGTYKFESINYLEKKDGDYLKSINPINQIPILLDGDTKIFDSRVIYNYVAKKHQLKSLSMDEENILSAIDAALDTSINLFSLRRGGLDLATDNYYIERQKERIPLILNYLNPWVKTLDAKKADHWNFLTMSLYSYLYWGEYRDIVDLSAFPEHKKFLENFKSSPGVAETAPPAL